MYCPRCGHQTTSDELRFCSYCGFKLGVVRAALAEIEETPATVAPDQPILLGQPRHREINIGVILMFFSAVFATFIAGTTGLGRGRAAGGLVFGLVYLALIVLSRPITRGILKLLSWEEGTTLSNAQRGMGLGATMMFVTTIVLSFSSLLMYGRVKSTPLFVGIGLAFAFLLLVGPYVMKLLKHIIQDDTKVPHSMTPANPHSAITSAIDASGLPPAQGTPVPLLGTQRVVTAEIVAPSSITEHTTNLLEK